jgi:chromate reductase
VAVLDTSIDSRGTRLAQASSRQVLHACGALVMPSSTLLVANAGDRFDADGTSIDLPLVQFMQGFLRAFERWIERQKAPPHGQTPATVSA